MMDFNQKWTDQDLYRYFELTDEEIAVIESTMRPLTLSGDNDIISESDEWKEIYEMKAVVPNHTLVNSFEEIVHPIEQIIRIAKQETRESTKLRDLLLPMLTIRQATVE